MLSYFEGTATLYCYTSCTLNTLHISKVSFLQCCHMNNEQPVCTSLLFTLLFIESQYTVFCFLFLYILLFFCTSCCFFAHLIVFCTSHCLLHILLSFAHLIVFCTSYCFALFYFIAHFILISPFLTICMPLCYVTYIICILIVLHCHWADLIRLHFTSSYALYNYYVTNKETLNPWKDIIQYLEQCERCTHFCEILYVCIYAYWSN